jgi:VIT1/CCC1 family predicted Fe2+/Mn2+ transporter
VSFVGHLDPDESLGEILAGLIMVLTFTLAAGVATRGAQDGVRTLLLAAVCNLAWGIIDAVFYVLTNAFVRRRRARLFRAVSAAASEDAALATIRHELDPELEAITRPDIFCLVFATTLPAVLPFLFVRDPWLALRISNLFLLGCVFIVGFHWARYINANPWLAGLALTGLGLVLVAIAMALGG